MTSIVDVDNYGTLEQAKEVLSREGWLSPEDLAARDKAVRDAALDVASGVLKAKSMTEFENANKYILPSENYKRHWAKGISFAEAELAVIKLKATPTRFQEEKP